MFQVTNEQAMHNATDSFWGDAQYSVHVPTLTNSKLNAFIHSPGDFDKLPFEERVRIMYNANAFNSFGYRPGADIESTVSYVWEALQNLPITDMSLDAYPGTAMSSRSIFEMPEYYTPEDYAELRRVADKMTLYHRISNHEFINKSSGIGIILDQTSYIDMLAPDSYARRMYGTNIKEPMVLSGHLIMNPGLLKHASLYVANRIPLSLRIAWSSIDFITNLTDWLFFPFYYRFYKDSVFDRGSLLYQPPVAIRGMAGGCGFGTSSEPFQEDPAKYIADLDMYLNTAGMAADFGKSVFVSYWAGIAGSMGDWFEMGDLFLQKDSLNLSIILLILVFFSLLSCLFLISTAGSSFMQYSSIFELMSLSLASLFSLFSVSWYDPFGQIMALMVVVVSSCEFIILLSQSVGLANNRSGVPLMSLSVFLFFAEFSITSCLTYVCGAAVYVCTSAAQTAVVWWPAVAGYAVPAFGWVLFFSSLHANLAWRMTQDSTYPVYGERFNYGVLPWSPAGSDKVHATMEDLSKTRHLFSNIFGIVDPTHTANMSLSRSAGMPKVFNFADSVSQYGSIGSTLLGAAGLLLAVFVTLLFIFSTKIRWVDLREAGTQYECGADHTATRVSPTVLAGFFRLLTIFLIFELEIFIWFLGFPLVSLFDVHSIVTLFIFLLIIQLATMVEIRSGALNWMRSSWMLPLMVVSGGGAVVSIVGEVLYVCAVACLVFLCFGVVRLVWRRGGVNCVFCVPVLAALLLLAVPLVKNPDTYVFLAKDLSVDRRLADGLLAVLDSPKWTNGNLAVRKALIKPLMAPLLAAVKAGNVGFWSAYCELWFSAGTEAELNAVVTLLRYHINANLSALTEFKLNIERKTDFCFKFATKPPVNRENFERCVQASMDIMYSKSLDTKGCPRLDFSGGVPDTLRDAWHRTFQECWEAKTPELRARKCRMAAALRSEFLFFLEAPENVGK